MPPTEAFAITSSSAAASRRSSAAQKAAAAAGFDSQESQVSTTDSQTPFVQGESGEDGGGYGGGEDGGGGGGGSLCCFGGGITNKEAGNEVFHLQKKAKVAPMALQALIGLLPAASIGAAMGFTSIGQEFFSDPKRSTLDNGAITKEEGSWFVSIMFFGATLGNLLSFPLADLLGRRRTLMFAAAALAAGWAALAAAQDLTLLLTGRMVAGVAFGVLDPCSYLWLSEITLIRFRGVLGVLNLLFLNLYWLVLLLYSAFSSPLSMSTLLAICCLPPLFFVVLSYFLVESPLWLVRVGRVAEAEGTVSRLRGGKGYPAMEEVKEMARCSTSDNAGANGAAAEVVKVDAAVFGDFEVTEEGLCSKLRVLRDKKAWKPALVLAIMFVFQIMSGAEVVCYYSLDIIKQAGLDKFIDKYQLGALVHASFVLGYLVSTPIMACARRRWHFVGSASAMGVCMAILGTCLQIEVDDDTTPLMRFSATVLPAVCLMLSGFLYSIGVGPVCFTLLGELFPVKAKAACSSVVVAFRFFFASVILKLSPGQRDLMGMGGVFQFNAACCFLSCAFVLRFLPETQGLTLTQLEKLFESEEVEEEDEEEQKQAPAVV